MLLQDLVLLMCSVMEHKGQAVPKGKGSSGLNVTKGRQGSALAKKGLDPQCPSEVSRVGLAMVTRVSQQSRSTGKYVMMRQG